MSKTERLVKRAFLGEVSSVPLRQSLRHLQKMSEPLDIRWSRPLPEGAEPSTVTVSRDAAGRWHVLLLVEATVSDGAPTASAVGIDASLVALSAGEKVTNREHARRDRKRLTLAHRRLARKAKGSDNRTKARVTVARVHARITGRRRDHPHELTTRSVRENRTLVIEVLAVRKMVRNHSLARAISDAAWSEMRSVLSGKCEWYGRDLVVVDRWYPSSTVCSACGAHHDRDGNAAPNIRGAGPAVLACEDDVRPARAQALAGSGR